MFISSCLYKWVKQSYIWFKIRSSWSTSSSSKESNRSLKISSTTLSFMLFRLVLLLIFLRISYESFSLSSSLHQVLFALQFLLLLSVFLVDIMLLNIILSRCFISISLELERYLNVAASFAFNFPLSVWSLLICIGIVLMLGIESSKGSESQRLYSSSVAIL